MDRSLRLDPNQLSGLPVVHPPPMLREAAEGSAAETLRRVETLEAPAAAGAAGRPRRDQVDGRALAVMHGTNSKKLTQSG